MLDINISLLRFDDGSKVCDFFASINSGWGLVTEVERYGSNWEGVYTMRIENIEEWYQEDPVNFLEVYKIYLGKDVSLDEAINDLEYNYSGNFEGWLTDQIQSEYRELFENIIDYCAGRLSLKKLVKKSENIDEEAGSYIYHLDYLE